MGAYHCKILRRFTGYLKRNRTFLISRARAVGTWRVSSREINERTIISTSHSASVNNTLNERMQKPHRQSKAKKARTKRKDNCGVDDVTARCTLVARVNREENPCARSFGRLP